MAFVAAVLATIGAAQATYIVDDNGGPGVDYTSIQTAIGSVAPGDTLIVRTGNYGPFAVDKELTIVGEAGVVVSQGSQITGVSSSRGVRMAQLELANLHINGCTGPVLCDQVNLIGANMASTPYSPALRVENSSDVRFQRSVVRGRNGLLGGDPGWLGALVLASRVEFSSCTLRGGSGRDANTSISAFDGGDGADALYCDSGAFVHLARTQAFGGVGGNACAVFCSGQDGYGGHALSLDNGSSAVVAGEPSTFLQSGAPGMGYQNASGGHGVFAWNSALRWSGVTIRAGEFFLPGVNAVNSTVTVPLQPDPTLQLIGEPTAGQSLLLGLHGTPGQNARLQQGNETRLVADGLSVIEKLNNRIRLHPLGMINGAGEASYSATVASSMPPGWTRIFQGLQIDPQSGGLDERTNSVFVIVR